MAPSVYDVGPFRVDRVAYRMTRGSETVELSPKLLDLLLYLLERPAALVTKEELLDALWPGANVTENALAQAVSELRQAIGDEAASPTFIKTVARRGYRLIAPVQAIDAPVAVANARPDPLPAAAHTMVVMDFANVTGEVADAWLSHGIAETVTGDLRALGRFRVVDRRRVAEAVAATNGSLQAVTEFIGARLAVVGSFQRTGGRIRITARAVDIVSGEAFADAKVDGALDDIFDLQDQVVSAFARELGIATGSPSAPASRDTSSLDAFHAFTEGSVRIESLNVRQMPQAIADFERAVAADPRYARAFAGLASAQLASFESSRCDNEPDRALLDRAVDNARHAVRLDEALAEAHATLALVLVSTGRTEEAAAAARRAVTLEPANWRHWFRLGHATWGSHRLRAAAQTLALYPDFAFAHFQSAMVFVARGDLAQAEVVLRQGAAVQDRQIARGGRYPALGLHWLLGLVRLAQDDGEEAIAEFDREATLAEPHRLYGREFTMHALYGRGAALLRTGRHADAIDSLRRAAALYPDSGPVNLALAIAQRAAGSIRDAEASARLVARALATLAVSRPLEAALVRAQVLATQGDVPGAASAAENVLAEAPAGFAGWTLPIEPILRQLVDQTAFAAVRQRLIERAR